MFETALAETSGDRGAAASMALAVGAHLAAALAIVGASLYALGPTPRGPDMIVPVVIVEPPPLGGAESWTPPRRTAPRQPPRPEEVVQPRRVAEAIPELPAEAGPATTAPAGPPGLPEGTGFGPGSGGGAGEGVEGAGNGAGYGIDTGAVTPLEVGGDVAAPILLVKVEPRYPETARRAGLQGTVVVRAVIAPDGSVENVSVVSSTSPLFDAAARDAVARWRYRPAVRGGAPVRVWLTVTVTFKVR